MHVPAEEEMPQLPLESREGSLIQRGRIYKSDVVRMGATPGCRGCRAVLMNEKVHGHTEECRQRFMEEYIVAGEEADERRRTKLARRVEAADSAEATSSSAARNEQGKKSSR